MTLTFCSSVVLGQDSEFTGYATSIIMTNATEIKTYGFKDQSRIMRYDSLTIQPVGSVSKVIIGLAIVKAAELGFVNLDTDINQYIKFKVFNPNLKNNQPITLRHLASHTSGIKDNEKFYVQAYTEGLTSPFSLEEFLLSYLDKKGKRYSNKNFGNYPAGEEFNYSNIGSALAAYAIECASEMLFDEFTERYIFQPLDMRYTHWFYDENLMETYTQLFDEKDNSLAFYSLATYPDGAMKTNIVDLTKLLQALISGYQGDSNLLDERSWQTFFAKNFSETKPIRGVNPKEPNCGIFIVYAKSGAIGHTGSDPGICTFMFFNPESKTGKIFMANEDLTSQNLDTFKMIWENLKPEKR
jgi:CubicO group peptidase (beta-lactamase class C family)